MCHNHNHDNSHDLAAVTTRDLPRQPVAAELAQCPVMPGNVVDKAAAEAAGLVRDHQGQRYYLCCAECGPLFDDDPSTYVTTA